MSKFLEVASTMTPEQRKENLLLAKIKRQEASDYRKANEHLLKLDYADMYYWLDLASKYKIRMPYTNEPCSVKLIRKYLRKANVPVPTWNDHYTSMEYFVKHNPKWTAVATTGLILELKEEMEKHNDTMGQ